MGGKAIPADVAVSAVLTAPVQSMTFDAGGGNYNGSLLASQVKCLVYLRSTFTYSSVARAGQR
jgi:hypothetical protein